MQDRTKREQFRSTIKPGDFHCNDDDDDGYVRIIIEIMRITMMILSFFVCHTIFCAV